MHGFNFCEIADLRLTRITVTEASDARDLDEFNSLRIGIVVALAYALWNAVKRDTSPFVWDHFIEGLRNAGDQALLDELREARSRRPRAGGSH